MSPEKTPGLWKANDTELEHLKLVDDVRMASGPVLEDLSAVFDKVRDKAEVADPLFRIYFWGLSQIQGEAFAVHGLQPSDFMQYGGGVLAHVAPPHEMIDYQGKAFATRVVRFLDDGDDDNPDIEIFGLNIYTPSQKDILSDLEESKGLLLVDQRGQTNTQADPVTGVTNILAVRNKTTGISTVFRVGVENECSDATNFMGRPMRTGNTKIEFPTPDGRFVEIEVLVGTELEEALAEFNRSAEAVKAAGSKVELTEFEAAAVQNALYNGS